AATRADTGVAAKDCTACSTPPSSTMGNDGVERRTSRKPASSARFERRAAWPAKWGDDQFCERGRRGGAQRRVEASKDLIAVELRPHRDGGAPVRFQHAPHFT